MSPLDYSPPVDQLLRLGEKEARAEAWMDYRALGLGREHIPELRRMMHDRRFYDDPEIEPPEFFGGILAGRAVAQIAGIEAFDDLLAALEAADATDSDWVLSDFIDAVELIGGEAIAPLRAYLGRESKGEGARQVVAEALGNLGMKRPELRAECLEALSAQLGRFERNSGEFNGALVASLVDLKAVEAAPVIEMAYQMDCVDPFICGYLSEVKRDLGAPLTEAERAELGEAQGSRQASLGRIPPRPGAGGKVRAEKKKSRKRQGGKRRR